MVIIQLYNYVIIIIAMIDIQLVVIHLLYVKSKLEVLIWVTLETNNTMSNYVTTSLSNRVNVCSCTVHWLSPSSRVRPTEVSIKNGFYDIYFKFYTYFYRFTTISSS